MTITDHGMSVISVRVDGLVVGDKIQPGSHRIATINHVKKIGRFVVFRITANNKQFITWYLSGDKIKKVIIHE